MDEIFRIAHSLKGMSATMGFAQIAKLTHEMEDVFELLRQRGEGLTREAIDTVLACLDALTASFESIEADGEEALDPTPLVERLHGLVRARTAEQELERVATDAGPRRGARHRRPPARAPRRGRPRRSGPDARRPRAHGVRRAWASTAS